MSCVLRNQFDNTVIQVDTSPFTIGRGRDANFVLVNAALSRTHCSLERNSSSWTFTDKSTNGSFVNNRLLRNTSCELQNGDTITIAPNLYQFSVELKPPNTNTLLTDEDLCELAMSVEQQQDNVPPSNPESSSSTTEIDVDHEVNIFQMMMQTDDDILPEPAKSPSTEPEDEATGIKSELTCVICSYLFIKAVTLNCSHSFCQFCINTWNKTKNNCPVCRTTVKTISPSIVLDNLITKCLETISLERRLQREKAIEDRMAAPVQTPQLPVNYDVVEVSSQDSYSDFYSDESSDDSEEMYGIEDMFDIDVWY